MGARKHAQQERWCGVVTWIHKCFLCIIPLFFILSPKQKKGIFFNGIIIFPCFYYVSLLGVCEMENEKKRAYLFRWQYRQYVVYSCYFQCACVICVSGGINGRRYKKISFSSIIAFAIILQNVVVCEEIFFQWVIRKETRNIYIKSTPITEKLFRYYPLDTLYWTKEMYVDICC